MELINDDMAMPQVMALVWEVTKSDIKDEDKKATLLDFDKVLGLGLDKIEAEKVPQAVIDSAEQRLEAKKAKDFKKSDELRDEIGKLGFEIEDTKEGYKLKRK